MAGAIQKFHKSVICRNFSVRRWSTILIAMAAALIAGIADSMNVFMIFSDYFMPGTVSFIQSWFLVFTLGSIFSEFLTRSGSVASIAYKLLDIFGQKNATVVIAIITAVLTIGGVNPYVQIFMAWPICVLFSRETGIPRGVWIGVFYLGMFSSYNFPGNPGMTNVILAQNLGVSSASAPVLSMFLFIFYFVLGSIYFKWRVKSWRNKGILYVESPGDQKFSMQGREGCPNFWKSLTPMVFVVVLFTLLTSGTLKFLPSFTSVNAILLAMVLGTILCILLNFSVLKPQLKDALVKSSTGGVNPVITAGVITGYLGVVMGSSSYEMIISGISNISGGPFIQAFIACNVLTFITGGGAMAASPVLDAFKSSWLGAGVNGGILRSVMASSLAGVAISPHCGGLHGVLDYTGSDLKESYGSIFFGNVCVSIVTSLIGAFIATVLM